MQQKGDILRARARNRLCAAVLFVDDFTGRPIESRELSVGAAELPTAPVSKPDGWYLFLNYGGDTLTVTVSGRYYEQQTVKLDCTTLDPLSPAVRVRLRPNRSYPMPAHAICLEGTALPDREVRLWCSNDPGVMRLNSDYAPDGEADGMLLRLYDPRGSDPAGRCFALLRRGSQKEEYFSVRQRADGAEGECLLEAPLRSSCKKIGAKIYPVYVTRTDAQGRFILLLPFSADGTVLSCRIQVQQSDGSWESFEAEPEAGTYAHLELKKMKK